jgi:hypothetical protein
MNKVADILDSNTCFSKFTDKDKFRTLPKEYTMVIANHLLDKLYGYADANRIWLD